MPLVGRSGSVKGVDANTAVKCPDCGLRYYVVPDGSDGAAVREVTQV
jgi:hypothetical protein